MDQFTISRLSVPIVTGTPQTGRIQKGTAAGAPVQTGEGSFRAVLERTLAQNSGIEFSKHAVNRVMERNIDVSESNLTRLGEGIRIAQEKGLNDTLILVDATAFLVNVRNNKVITTVNGEDLKGNVFTNIDGTVII